MSSEKSISESLRYIYDKFGIDTFLDEKKIHSILSDLSPKAKNEIAWVVESINDGSIKTLVDSIKNNSNIEEAKSEFKNKLKKNELSDIRIEYMLSCFSYGFRLTEELLSLDDIKCKYRQKEKKKAEPKKPEIKKDTKNTNTNTKKAEPKINKDKPKPKDDSTKTKTKQNNYQAEIDKLKIDYKTLYTCVNDYINYNVKNYIYTDEQKRNRVVQGMNILGALFTLAMMIAYFKNFGENVYKLTVALSVFSIILGIGIIAICAENISFKNISAQKSNIYKKLQTIRDAVDRNSKYIESQSMLSREEIDKYKSILNMYQKGYNTQMLNWKNTTAKNSQGYQSIKECILVMSVIFIICGVRETTLVNDLPEYRKGNIPVISQIVYKLKDIIYKDKYWCYVYSDYASASVNPEIDSDVVMNINQNYLGVLTGKKIEKDGRVWHELKIYDKAYAWIQDSDIFVVPKTLKTTENSSNIRTSASLYSTVQDTVDYGTKLTTTGIAIADPSGERIWYQVIDSNYQKGWISSKIVTED